MGQLYDVVFYGLQDGYNPRDVAAGLSKHLALPPAEAVALVAQKGALIKKSLNQEDASRLAKLLHQVGAKVNYRPTLDTGTTLSLVAKTSKVVCPQCGHVQEYADDESATPETCPKCGIIFAKYQEILKRREEEEEVRRRLLRMNATREETEAKMREEEEAEQRRRLLEERIRRELGLPPMLNKRWKLYSSAAVTLFLGVGLGLGGGYLFFLEPKQLDRTQSGTGFTFQGEQSMEAMIDNLDMENFPSGQGVGAEGTEFRQAVKQQEQLLALSQSIVEQTNSHSALSGSAQTATPDDPSNRSVTAGTADTSDTDPAAAIAPRTDAEWTYFLKSTALNKLQAGAAQEARTLAAAIDDPREQLLTQAHLAASLKDRGQTKDADALIAQLTQTINALSAPGARVEYAAMIAPIFFESKAADVAATLMQRAVESAQTLKAADERALAWADIALAYARLDQPDQARRALRAASEVMRDEMTPEQRIETATRLAPVFTRLGSTDNAAQILTQAERVASEIEDRRSRDRARRLIAGAWFKTNDLKRALDSLADMSSSDQRDVDILALIREQAFSGTVVGLSAFAETMRSERLKAQAYAYLGVATSDRSAAETYFAEALRLSGRIKEALDQIAIQAEIARFMRRASFEQTSKNLFARIEKQVATLTAPTQQDLAFIRLSEHSSRALDLAQAETYLSQVKDSALQTRAREDLERVGLVIRAI